MSREPLPPTRRTVLRSLAAASLFAAVPAHAAPPPAWRADVLRHLESLRRPDGGFAFADQDESHLTPTFAAVGCYRLLKQDVPDKAKLAAFVRAGHPLRKRKPERELHAFEQQQIQTLLWLDEDASSFAAKVKRWTEPLKYPANYELSTSPVFQQELTALTCRELLGLPMDDAAGAFVPYVESRQRPNGSFNNTPASDGADGHVMNTWWGLCATRALGREIPAERRASLIDWLRRCQLPGGGFTWQPDAPFAKNDDVAYTWAALLALKFLGGAPAEPEAAVRHLQTLRNADGGFADRPGWLSNPVATYYALGALEAAGALDADPAVPARSAPNPAPLPAGLKVFTIQIESHGKGSPAEAVELARSLRIDLWGAKNAAPAWLRRAQQVADERDVPVRFFAADEEYGTYVTVPGLGTYSHTSDLFAPAGADIGPSVAKTGPVTWEQFREKRLAPLQKGNGRLFWQFGENEELTRLYLDDSLARGGYAAISTFHFGNPDFTLSQPFLHRYHGRIPWIALQDAHGNEPWWFADQTTGFRTLFLAAEPTWDGWLTALKNNWTAAVRHDAVTESKTRMHAGDARVAAFVRQHEAEWKWWGENESRRPLCSIVVVKPEDEFEAARPETGLSLRVRTRWDNTTQGLPKKQIVELLSLTLDDQPLAPRLVQKKNPKGAITDQYHLHPWPTPTPGRHAVTATLRVLETKAESRHTIHFTV